MAALAIYVAWPEAQREADGIVATSSTTQRPQLRPETPSRTDAIATVDTPSAAPAPNDVASLDPVLTLDTNPPAAGRLSAPMAEPSPVAGWPTLGVVSESGDGTPSLLAADFARQIGPGAQMNVSPITTNGWAASLAALRVQPRVTVARYDLLQAVRRVPEAASVPPLEIVAPLATEPVYFVAKADSPLRYIHEIESRVINIGPQNSARALTAATVYRDMFSNAVPASRLSRLDEDAALDALVRGDGVDVVVVVGSSPHGLLGRLGREGASPVKLLELDPGRTTGRRVVRTFLPATIEAGALGSFPPRPVTTLSVMSFLVTSPGANGNVAGHDRAISSLARSLCSQLPELRRDTSGAWRGVQPGLQLDVGWPYSRAAQKVFADCPAATGPTRRVAGS